jgi:acetyl-CoA carboxylase carboxyltransferase component
MVFAFPGARVAVMGPAGREYIYKDELVKARAKLQEAIKAGREEEGKAEFNRVIAEMNARYENELMNPKEALALGSISRIVMPGDSRRVLGQALNFYMRRYKPGPLSEPQREFH